MRSPDEIRERILLTLIEEMNKYPHLIAEPEQVVPKFLETVSNKLSELVLDEISFKRKY